VRLISSTGETLQSRRLPLAQSLAAAAERMRHVFNMAGNNTTIAILDAQGDSVGKHPHHLFQPSIMPSIILVASE